MSATMEVVNKVLSGVAAKFQSRDRQRAQTWDQLIVRVCDGKAKEAEIAEVLDTIGRTPEEVCAAVNRLMRRRTLAAQMAAAERAAADMGRIAGEIAATDAEYEAAVRAAEARHGEKVYPLREQLKQAQETERRGGGARAELAQNAPREKVEAAEAVGRELESLTRRALGVKNDLEKIENELRHVRNSAPEKGKEVNYTMTVGGRVSVSDSADVATAGVPRWEATAAELKAQLDALAPQIADVEKRKLATEAALLLP